MNKKDLELQLAHKSQLYESMKSELNSVTIELNNNIRRIETNFVPVLDHNHEVSERRREEAALIRRVAELESGLE